MKFNIIYLFIILTLSVTAFTSCDDNGNLNFFSVDDDANLGKQLDTEIRTNSQEYPLYNSLEPNQYLQNIVNEIKTSTLMKYTKVFPYKVQIIGNDKVVNAFCTPGGYIYVYTGLMKFLDDEATIAGVLGHEIAHAELRHSSQRMTQAYGIQILISIALGNNPSQLEQIAGNLFSGLYLLKNSRDDEYESDEYSFKYLLTSKWYAGAIKYFFNKVKTNETATYLEILLSTHPMPQDRLDKVEQMIKLANLSEPNEGNLFSVRYKQILQKLN